MSDKTIRFSDGFYWDDIGRRLAELKAIYMPWHTETDPNDPINGLLRKIQWKAHRDGSILDDAATESFWLTLRQRASAIALGRMNGYDLAADIPATVDVLSRLTGLPSLPGTVVPEGALFSTKGDQDADPVTFEADEDLDMASTTLEVYWDAANNTLYVGHQTMEFAGFDFSAVAYAGGSTFAKEYYDGAVIRSGAGAGGVKGWTDVPSPVDGTSELSGAGTVSWSVPALNADDTTWWRKWERTTVNSVEAYWVRYRRTGGAGTVTTPAAVIGTANWFALVPCTQGETVVENLGTTTSDPSQSFPLGRTPYVEGSLDQLLVGTETNWVESESFYLAGPQDRAFLIEEEINTGWEVQFGDGVNGRIPDSGLVVQGRYRINADEDGNVGNNTVTVNRSATPRLTDVTNPRPASGWVAAMGSTAESLEQVRRLVPADLRALGRAVSLEDYETLVQTRFRTADGRQPVVRSYADKDAVGYRTVKLILVGTDGEVISSSDVTEVEEYFNGTRRGTQRVGGVAMHNALVDPENYTQRTIDVTTTIQVLREVADGAQDAVEEALEDLLSPVAKESNGVDWIWWPDMEMSEDRIRATIVAAVPGFVKFVSFTTTPLMPYTLAADALPVPGTLTVTIVEV